MRALLLLLAGLAGLASPAAAAAAAGSARGFQLGDGVAMLRRSQHQGWRTEWTDVLRYHQPAFGVDSTVALEADFKVTGYATDQELKMEFSFAGDRLLVPWVVVSDGGGQFLSLLEFEFVRAGDEIRGVTATPFYMRPEDGRRPEFVYLRYRWVEEPVLDVRLGLRFSFALAAILSGLLARIVWTS